MTTSDSMSEEKTPKKQRRMRLRVSPLFWIFAVATVFLGFWYEFAMYFICIILHEMAHAEAARRLGYALSHIKLMPYGAGLEGSFESARWDDEILIALAGPLLNIVLALVFVSLWWVAPSTYYFTERLVWANFFTAVFNFLPVFPLDGGRMLLAALSAKIPRQKAYKVLRAIGYAFCTLFFVLFVLSLVQKANITLILVAFFMLTSTIFPDKNSQYQRLYSMAFRSQKLKKGVLVREIIISDNASLLSLMRQINSNYYYRFLIINQSMTICATLTEQDLESLLQKNPPTTPISTALTSKIK